MPRAMDSGGRFQQEPGLLGSMPHPRDCQESWSDQRYPRSDMELRSDAFDYFVVHHAVACQVREVRVLEESGVSPHHPVQMKLKRSFQGLVTRVQVIPSAWTGTSLSRRTWKSVGGSSCSALIKKFSEDVTFLETRHEPTCAGD